MGPILNMGLKLATTKGFDFVLGQKPTTVSRGPFQRPTPDGAPEYALAALAIAPQLVNVLGPSPLVERFYAMTPKQLYWLYKARPYLQGVSLAALGGLMLRQRAVRGEGKAVQLATQAVMALRAGESVLSPPAAFDPTDEPHLTITSRELDRKLKPEDRVLGLVLDGEARCYPLQVLLRPHLIHDTVGGIPVVPTYCDLSNGAIAYRDEWRGERLDLHVVSSPNGNVAFYESHSDGIIQQLDGIIAAGPHEGAILQTFPLALTTWRQWQALHPDTTGVWYEQSPKGGAVMGMLRTLERLDGRQSRPLFTVRGGVDPRLPAKTEVFGVRMKGKAIAFERANLLDQPVQNLELGGEPVVVLYDDRHDIAACFSRRQQDQLLTFRPAAHGTAVAEDDHGRLWEVAGTPADGGAGQLRPAAFTADKVRWYAWAHFNPGTAIAGQATRQAQRV